jgi:F-type H+-transporting ATPase subunit epsilon
MALLFAELIAPDRIVFEGEVRSVVLSGVEGDMTVLPGHAPLVTLLFPGMVFAIDAEGQGRRAFVRGGVAEITGTKVTILAERVLPVEELTRDQIDDEILHLQLIRDTSGDEASRAQANASISRLEEFKGSMRL